MNKFISILLSVFLGLTLKAGEPEVYFIHANFNSPKIPFVETYISFIGNSLVFIENDAGNYHSELEITAIFKQNEEIKHFDKYIIKSPEINDSLDIRPNFIDQQRYGIQNGIYNLELFVRDLNSDNPGIKFIDVITIDYNDEDLQFSEIQPVENAIKTAEPSIMTKNNLDLIPYVANFYPANMANLMFYVEIYNSDKTINDDFMLRYFVEKYETGSVVDISSRFRRLSPAPVNPFLGELNIQDLSSGNYNLVIELRNRENELIKTKKYFFQRSNYTERIAEDLDLISGFEMSNMFFGDVGNVDSLREYISSLRPISFGREQSFIDYRVNSAPKEVLQKFFYDFWVARDPINPNRSWMTYKEQVDFVNRGYSTLINKGYQTDRGRVYLQYGAPNSIYISKHEPSAYPYEIWHYAEVANERNRRFVFYNPHIVGEEFELLHSELTGELKNPNWERLLHKRNHTIYDFDQRHADDHWGSRARDEFRK